MGGGPGGLTLARLLQLSGTDVKVYERDLDENARVQGSPLDMHDDSGLKAIIAAGLLDEFKRNFLPGADREKIMNEQAEVFFSDHDEKVKEDFDSPVFRPEISRGALRKMLLDSLQPDTIVWNSHFISMEKKGEGWLLNFKNRHSVYADIVIGSDGANSKIRPYITNAKPFYSGITMLEGNVFSAENHAPNMSALLNGGKIMAFGKGKNILMGQKGNDEIGFYASFRTTETWAADSGLNFADRAEILQWFDQEYSEWAGVWKELFQAATLPFIPRPIYCMPFDQTWEAVPNCTIIGDAAHVMPPFAGEGANMAMLDALELSTALTAVNGSIADYEMNMRVRAVAAAKESLTNGESMHSEHALNNMLEFFGAHREKE